MRINYNKTALVAINLFVFFSFFGTSVPFRPENLNVDYTESNIINQLVYVSIFLLSLLVLLPRWQQLWDTIRREKFLTLFLCWSVITIAWSDFSIISIKRLFQVVTIVMVCHVTILYIQSEKQLLGILKRILSVYLILSILSVMFIPGAIDIKFMTWRGLASHKNHLGQVSLLNAMIWFYCLRIASTQRERIIAFGMLIIALALLFGAESMTGILTLTIITGLAALMWFNHRLFKSAAIGRFLSLSSLAAVAAVVLSIIYLAPDLLDSMASGAQRDMTFTGRTFLWSAISYEIANHFWFGCGFAGFWIVENTAVMDIYQQFVWLPKQSHMGYLDIINETGMVGFGFFLAAICWYCRNLLRLNREFFWKWVVLAVLIMNFLETTIFRPGQLSGAMFIFAYLQLYRRY